jgi:hypothetical protein
MPPTATTATNHAGELNLSRRTIAGINDPTMANMFSGNETKYGTLLDVPHDGQSIETRPLGEGKRSITDGRTAFEHF